MKNVIDLQKHFWSTNQHSDVYSGSGWRHAGGAISGGDQYTIISSVKVQGFSGQKVTVRLQLETGSVRTRHKRVLDIGLCISINRLEEQSKMISNSLHSLNSWYMIII